LAGPFILNIVTDRAGWSSAGHPDSNQSAGGRPELAAGHTVAARGGRGCRGGHRLAMEDDGVG